MPPDPCGAASQQYELAPLPVGTTQLRVCMRAPTPIYDYDLWMGLSGRVRRGLSRAQLLRHRTRPRRLGQSLLLRGVRADGGGARAYAGLPIAIGVSARSAPMAGAYTLNVITSGSAGPPVPSMTGASR